MSASGAFQTLENSCYCVRQSGRTAHGAMKKLLQVCVEELRCAGPGRVRQFLVVTRKVWEREIMVAGIPVDLHRLARLSHRFLEPFNIGLADVIVALSQMEHYWSLQASQILCTSLNQADIDHGRRDGCIDRRFQRPPCAERPADDA